MFPCKSVRILAIRKRSPFERDAAQISSFAKSPSEMFSSSGEIPPNPSELLGSRRMEFILDRLRESFDYIIIDLPPVNIVSDALSIASLIDGMVVVVREDYTEKKELERCFRQLQLSNVNVLGCILNESKNDGGSYKKYRKHKYYKYYKYYQGSSKSDRK